MFNEVIETLILLVLQATCLSNSAVRTMYHSLPEAVTRDARRESEEQELEGEEEEQEPEGEEEEQETSTPFKTPLHSAMPPLPTIRKVEERAPSKPSLPSIPKPEHSGSVMMPTRHTTSRASSSIPVMSTKHESGKASTGQAGKGRRDIAEYVHTAIPTVTTKRAASQATSQMGQGYWPGRWLGPPLWPGFGQPKATKPSLPGKPIRWLRLY